MLFMNICFVFFFLMIRQPPVSTRTDTPFPCTTLVRPGRLDGICMAPGTFADDVTIANSDFAAMGVVVLGTGEQAPKGWYPMERLTIGDSRFAGVAMVGRSIGYQIERRG